MKALLFLLTLYAFPLNDVKSLLTDFHRIKSETEEKAFIKKYGVENSATYQAYVCSMEMKQAEHAFSPIKKLSIFNDSKDKLEKLINKSPENIHLRYIRYLIQSNAPSFLAYNDNLEEDRKMLKNYIKTNPSDDTLSKYIKIKCSL
ncbi:hypothetical protein [Arcticibacterium luteifluviistationis]|uniref:Uncharacterized protein n=1 Tax=Arcticibacterium luteifluviistationis TaxID=1784714 RepID=A0A2Z4GCQ4_9BACT|nr:hypothetical protein [Arcticibacterium luteifluviistationis]AWV99016.1 hypothetical protein DJ013_12915 [Arcticibacterium luteifluviistationis]